MSTKTTESRLQRIEGMLRRLVSHAGISGIDHRPAAAPQVYRAQPAPGTALAGATAPAARKAKPLQGERLRAAFRAGRLAERERLQALLDTPEAARDPGLALDAYNALQGNVRKTRQLLLQAASVPSPAASQSPRRKTTARDVMAAAEVARMLRDGPSSNG